MLKNIAKINFKISLSKLELEHYEKSYDKKFLGQIHIFWP